MTFNVPYTIQGEVKKTDQGQTKPRKYALKWLLSIGDRLTSVLNTCLFYYFIVYHNMVLLFTKVTYLSIFTY